ncbi:MAG: TlpA family protein disulfide reductase [Desulfobulbaceae bacterium]|nr:TlpA family protein disulfide reductase [Desulfobulbaceae bacterium]
MRTTALSLVMAIFFFTVLTGQLVANEREVMLIPFKGYDLNGNPIDVATSIGNKPVMLIFWASWCPTCRTEVPKLNKLVEQYAERGMEFVGVNVGFNDSYRRAKKFAQKTGMIYPNLFDATGVIGEQYGLQGVPTVVIADKKGLIRFYGHSTPDISEEVFQQLMAN